jgi:twinkle protein
MLEYEIKINRYDLVVIDNLMSILSVQASEKYEQQADFMQRLCDISKSYSTHIILVLHPNKTYRKGENMDFEQISGSSDLYNKADNIITVIREYDEEKIDSGISGKIKVLKNRYFADLPSIDTYFDKDTGLLLERDAEGTILAYNFNWDNNRLDMPEGTKFILDSECPF